MKYKGYTGVVEFDEEAGVLFGRVIGLRDLITFEGESVAEVTRAFHDSVDVYLELCAERGEGPEKPFSGQFVLRIDPQLHRMLSHAAEERGVSLNSLVEERLKAGLIPSGGSAPSPARRTRGTAAAHQSPGHEAKVDKTLGPQGPFGGVRRIRVTTPSSKAPTSKSSKVPPTSRRGKS